MNIESEVRDNVQRLLTMLSPQVSEDSETFINVREKLIRMAIRGTLPPGSRPLRNGLIQDNKQEEEL